MTLKNLLLSCSLIWMTGTQFTFVFGASSQEEVFIHPGLNGETFVMEKITSHERLNIWCKYANKQLELVQQFQTMRYPLQQLYSFVSYMKMTKDPLSLKIYQDLKEKQPVEVKRLERYVTIAKWSADPLAKMKHLLLSAHNLPSKDQLHSWVVYVTDDPEIATIHKPSLETLLNHVVMSLGVITHEDAPMVIHMGISRGLKHMSNNTSFPLSKDFKSILGDISFKKDDLPQLSTKLHIFTAFALKNYFKMNKTYVMTTPMKKMLEIFEKSLKEHSVTYFTRDGIEPYYKTSGGHYYDKWFNFKLFDSNQNLIYDSSTSSNPNKDHMNTWEWYFQNTQHDPDLSPTIMISFDELSAKF